jgi:hypothetical protein
MVAYIKMYAVVSQITWHLVSLSKYLSYGLDLNFLQLTAVLFEPLTGIWLLGKKKKERKRERGGKSSMHFN